MTTGRRLLRQIGGSSAISIWSWVLTIPIAIVVSSTYQPDPSPLEIATWIGIVLCVHVVLGIAMWIAARTVLPRSDRRSRPVTALLCFAGIGFVRAVLMQLAQDSVGIAGGVFAERLAVNIVGGVVALSAIAIIVDDYRTDEGIVRRLQRAQTALSRIRDEEFSALRAADVEVLAQVHASVERELSAADADDDTIRRIADGIVRPWSHELAKPAESDLQVPADATEAGGRLTFAGAFGLMQAPPPLAVAVIVEATVLATVAVRFGPITAFANAVIGGFLILVGCWLVRRYLPLPTAPLVRLVVLAVTLAAIGAAAAEASVLALPSLASFFPAALIGVAGGVAGAGIALSLWSAVNAGRQVRQQALADAIAEEASEIERLRETIAQRRLQAARFLHGPIQGELVAAAMRRDSIDAIRTAVAQRFAEYESSPSRTIDQQVRDVIDSWSSILVITVTADAGCWEVLDDRPERAELLVDALSEALTNVVRHASTNAVGITISSAIDAVTLRVVSQGTPGTQARPGIGLAQLEARGARVALESDSGRVELTVTV